MELQPSDNENNNDLTDNITNSFHFLKQLKNRTFSFLFVLLKDNELSLYTTGFLCLLETIQAISLMFHSKFDSVWNSDDIFKAVSEGLGYTRFLPYIEDTTMALYSAILYVMLAVIVLIIVVSVYVTYIYEKKKTVFAWILHTIRILILLSNSIFYIPVFEYLFSFFRCKKNTSGVSVHAIFTDTVCGSSVQLVSAILAAISIVLFLAITSLTTITLFEARNIPTKPSSRVTARSSLIFNIYKLLIVILLTFINNSDYYIITIICIIAGSALLFYIIQFDNPFYNQIVAKIWSTAVSLILWSAIMLVFAQIMRNSSFKETIITWIIGLPLVIFISILANDKRMDSLLINVNKFENGNEIINQVTYLLKLLDAQTIDNNAAMLLDGYLEVHKQDCADENCPLKRKNKILTNNKIVRNLLSNDSTVSEKEAIVIYLVYQIYLNGLMVFPTDTTLHISYAFFLLDKMYSKQQALQELVETEVKKPPVDEQFIIFRYKRILEDEIAEYQNEQHGAKLDVMDQATFENHLRTCQANIEKASLLYLEFWSQLSEDQPDLARLEDIGSKITMGVENVEQYWTKLMKINPNNMKMIRLFGKFLIEVVHDKERGEELLDKARIMTNKNNKKNMKFVQADHSADDSVPLIVISGEQEKFAIITNINLAAASLFGFNKNEILNRKLNILLPPIYAKYHDSFINNYLAKNESEIVNKGKERLAFGKNKANYIFPFYYNLKAVPSIMQGIQFVSTLRVEKTLKNTAYVLTNSDGAIDSISPSCISLLKMDIKHILQKKLKIQDCIPNIISQRTNVFRATSHGAKAYARVVFTYPKDTEYLEEDEAKSVSLDCHVKDLVSTFTKDNFGILFNFDSLSKRSYSVAPHAAQITNFQFRYANNKASLLGEFAIDKEEETHLGRNDDLDQQEDNEEIDQIIVKKSGGDDDQDKEVVKIDYGRGIRTLKLVNGVVGEFEEEKSEGEEEEESGKEQTDVKKGFGLAGGSDEENLDEGSLADFGNSEKSRKVLSSVINDRAAPLNIRRLKSVGVIICLVLVGLSIFDYVNITNQVTDINSNIANLDIAHRLIANMMVSLSNVRDLYLLEEDIITADEAELRNSLKVALNAAKVLKENLEADGSQLSESHFNLLYNPVVRLNMFDGDYTTKGLLQATEDMITKGFIIAGADRATINPNNPDYYFLIVNMLNDYYIALVESSEYYAQDLVERTSSNPISFVLIFVFSIVVLVLALIVIIPIIQSVTTARNHIIRLFFDIPSKTIKVLYTECENFVSNLQVGEEDDIVSQLDEDEAEKEDEDNDSTEWMTRRRRKKKFKNTGKNYRSFFLTYAIMAGVLEAIFIYSFASSNSLLTSVGSVAIEFNATSFAELFYSFSNNAERQLFINSSINILNRDSWTVVSENIALMQNLDSQILSENSRNTQSHTNEYSDMFRSIMYTDSCSLLTAYVASNLCQVFADKTITKGMAVAIVRHFENMRTLLNAYKGIGNNEAWPFEPSYLVPTIDNSNSQRNERLSLFRVPQALEITEMQKIYIKNDYRKLLEGFKESLSDEFDNLIAIRLVMFILFLLLAAIVCLFVWIPLISRLNNRLQKTKLMLRMIPMSILVKIRNIRIYLRTFMNENHLHGY